MNADDFFLVQEELRQSIKDSKDFQSGSRLNGSIKAPNRTYKYLLYGAERSILTKEICEKVIGGIVGAETQLDSLDNQQRVHSYCDTVFGTPGFCIILLTVISYGTLHTLRLFYKHFLEQPCGKDDSHLPFDEDFVIQKLGNDPRNGFFAGQFTYLAVTLSSGAFRQEYQPSRIFPWMDEQELGSGAYGEVYKVKVARGHFLFREPVSRNADPIFLARKDFPPDKASYEAFRAEDSILQQLINPSANCPSSIMTPICSLVQTGTHTTLPSSSIFFLPAECNLYQYITDQDRFPGTDIGRLRNFQQMLGICRGLEWLHQNLVYETSKDRFMSATYYHCDLAPDNILVCCEPSAAGETLVFKISDFGQARGLRQRPEKPIRGKSKYHDSGRSGSSISSPAREGTYLAPEAQAGANSKSDVWSFGCILLMIIIFNYGGASAIKKFELDRVKYSDPRRKNDQFYVQSRDRNAVINPAVMDFISKLSQEEDPRDGNSDTNLTNSALEYLKDHVLVTRVQKRHSIEEVSRKLHMYYNDRPAIPVRAVLHGDIQSDAKTCSNFTDGRIFTYSTNRIHVYNPGHSDYIDRLSQNVDERWSDSVRPTSKSCAGTEVCVLSKPSTESEATYAGIHGFAESPKLRHVLLSEPNSPVVKLAFSPDGTMIAICCRPYGLKGSSLQIRLYIKDELIEMTETSRSLVDDPTSLDSLDRLMDGESGQVDDWRSIVEFCFSNDSQCLYCAYKVNQKPQVIVCSWNTETGARIADCAIRDDDPSIYKEFLTNIIPLNSERGFMYVMHEQFVGRRPLHGNFFPDIGEPTRIPGVSRLTALLLSSDDTRLVMLAQTRHEFQIYGCFLHALHKPKRLSFDNRHKIWYTPEEDNAYLKHSPSGPMKLVLTILKKKTTYEVNLDSLFVPDWDNVEE